MKAKYKVGIWTALKRIWTLGRCSHLNSTNALIYPDTTELIFCRNCGRMLSLTTEGERTHNPHYDFNQTGDHIDLYNHSKNKREKIIKKARTNQAM